MSELYKLPDGWKWKELISLTDIFSDGDWIESKDQSEDGIRLIQTGNVGIGLFKDREDKSRYISKETFERLNCTEIFENDCLISRLPEPVGRSCLIPKMNSKMITSVDCTIIRFNKNILPKFFVYYSQLNYYFNMIMNNATGATRLRISKKNLSKIPIPVPSLEEQKRIVAKLDILFAKIDKAIALHQKNIDEVNVFMASVLNDVFVELEEKYGLDNIGNMIDILTDYHSNGAYKNLKENVELLDKEDYALMIRATDLENEDYTNNVKYITESAYNFMSKSKVFGGEIILPKIGTIGNVYFMPYLERPVSLAMNLFMLKCSDKVMNKYMFLFLKSPRGNEDILNKANGAVTKTITKDAVKSIELPLPPIKTQQKIVLYLDEISQKMEKIKQIQKEKMESLKALKASILDQAFRGKL